MPDATYQDVLRANGVAASWAFTETSGTTFAPWIGGAVLNSSSSVSYHNAGPFSAAFALGLPSGGLLGLNFIAPVYPPGTWEGWFQLTDATPSSPQYLMYSGNPSSNGGGVYVATNGHVHFLAGGVTDVDTGFVWPDLSWHLVDYISESSTVHTVTFDGNVVARISSGATIAPTPNSLNWCSAPAVGAADGIFVSYPALYFVALTQQQTRSNFIAASDPNAGIGESPGGGSALSTDILDAVRTTYQNAP